MNDLQLFGLQCLGKSSGIGKVLHTEANVFLVENGELYMLELGKHSAFQRIIPDEAFLVRTQLEDLFNNHLCFGDGKSLNFYDYHKHKLSNFTLAFEYITSAWSPSQKYVALITNDKKIKTMRFHGENVNVIEHGENYLSNNSPQHCYMNSVWDLKIQNLKDKFIEDDTSIPLDESKNLMNDTSPPTIAWRGNGTMFVVNFYVSAKVTRTFKIFSDDCNYLFQGIHVMGLQSAVSWKPGLSFYITMPVAKKNKMTIGLFEKSGFLSEVFYLRDNLFVTKLEWSSDGSMLGVLQKDEKHSPLSIYFYKNKQWFLKQYLDFEDIYYAHYFHFVKHDSEIVFPLCVLTDDGIYKYIFKKAPYVTPGNAFRQSLSAYATINGSKVDLTIFAGKVLLTPTGMFQLEICAPINTIIFHPSLPKLVLMDSNTTLHLCEYSLSGFYIVRRYEWNDFKSLPFKLHHIFWGVDNFLHCVCISKNDIQMDKVFSGDLSVEKTDEIYFLPSQDLAANITYIGYAYDCRTVIEQRYIEVGLRLYNNSNLMFTIDFKSLPITVRALDIGTSNFIFALTTSNELYINCQKITKAVTSFIIHDKYLLFTRQIGILFCIRLRDDGIIKLASGEFTFDDVFTLGLDPSTTLLTSIPNSAEIVLALPKQNFETVKINLILIDLVEDEIRKSNWLAAYNIICEEGLDVNLLVDLNYQRFINNISNLIESVNSQTLLNKIIEEINDNNVFNTIYKNCSIEPPAALKDKVKTICEKMLIFLGNSFFSGKYISTIVICCMKSYEVFGLKESFFHIAKLFNDNSPDDVIQKSVLESIKYLKTQNSELEILKEGLMTYNIGLAEFLVRNLNMYTKEYEKFFNNLKESDYVSQRLQINQHICEKKFTVPSITGFEKIKYKQAHTTKSFEVLPKINLNNQSAERNKNELKLAEALETENRVSDACRVYERCLGHLISTCSLLAKKHNFSGAVRVAKRHRRYDLIESEVVPAAEAYCNDLINLLELKTEEYGKHIGRLYRIRESLLKSYKRSTLSNEAISAYTDGLQLSNEVGDAGVEFKSEVTENEYFESLKTLYELISIIFNYKNDVQEICYTLLSSPKRFYLKCKKLHNTLYDLQLKIMKDIPTIWPTPIEASEGEKLDTTQNSSIKYLKPPANVTVDWILPYFQK